jgi:hypothetical protein
MKRIDPRRFGAEDIDVVSINALKIELTPIISRLSLKIELTPIISGVDERPQPMPRFWSKELELSVVLAAKGSGDAAALVRPGFLDRYVEASSATDDHRCGTRYPRIKLPAV